MVEGGNDFQRGAGIRADGTKFSFKDFIRLVRYTKPRYFLFTLGLLFLLASSLVQVYVPQMASRLVNQFQAGLDVQLLLIVVVLFVFSAISSAIGGTILGIFGEKIIQNLRKLLWNQLTILKIPYLVASHETYARYVSEQFKDRRKRVGIVR